MLTRGLKCLSIKPVIVDCPGCSARYDVSGRPPGTQARCRCGTTFDLPHPPKAAASIQCPQCGASTRSTEPSCTYCGSALAVVRCPRCFGAIFAGARHCAHCGVRVEEPAVRHIRDGHENRPCPRCKEHSNLQGLLAGDVLIDYCATCGGLWLDHAVFEKVQEREEIRAPAMLSLAQLPKHDTSAPPHGYIPCPDCEALMTPRNFARRSGVVVDVCRAHGVWFDAGELPAIVEFIRGGGMELARRREVEELKEQKRSAALDAKFAQQRAARTSPSAGNLEGEISDPSLVAGIIGALFDLF